MVFGSTRKRLPSHGNGTTSAASSSPTNNSSNSKYIGWIQRFALGVIVLSYVSYNLNHLSMPTSSSSLYNTEPKTSTTTARGGDPQQRQVSIITNDPTLTASVLSGGDSSYPRAAAEKDDDENDDAPEDAYDNATPRSDTTSGGTNAVRNSNNNNDNSARTTTTTTTKKTLIRRDREAFPKAAQMGWNQVEEILRVLPTDGNLLVWGLGQDSVFWHATTTGRVIFLEDGTWDTNLKNPKERWYDYITKTNPQLEAYAVDYTTTNSIESYNTYMNQPNVWNDQLLLTPEHHNFPTEVLEVKWDVILVDAPLGHKNMGPGRYQSLYMSKLLAEAATTTTTSGDNDDDADTTTTESSSLSTEVHVFVDDYERKVERQFSQRVFDKVPTVVMTRQAHDSVPSNEQAHFVFTSTTSSDEKSKNAEAKKKKNDDTSSTTTSRLIKPTSPENVIREKSAFPKKAQMGWEQVSSILSVLPKDGNLLVWGLGNDSPFWYGVTTGKVIFLEDGSWNANLVNGKRWFDSVTANYPELEAYAIDYTTENSKEAFVQYMNHPNTWKDHLELVDFPEVVLETRWDVIIVDAPLGFGNLGPGRYQSLYMSKLLAESSLNEMDNDDTASPAPAVHVFVDDYERKVERQFSQKVYDMAPLEVVTRMARGGLPANEQAHFVLNKDVTLRGDLSALIPPEQWIVLVEVSNGYYDFFLNWLYYYDQLNLVYEVVVIAEDDIVQAKIEKEVKPTKHYLTVERSRLGLAASSFDFATKDYRTMVSARPTHILNKLKAGLNVIYADIDAVWQSNPMPFLTPLVYRKDILMQLEYDQCYWNVKIKPCYCTGFIAVVSNERTIQLMYNWQQALKDKPKLNQPIFNEILYKVTNVVKHAPLPKWAFPNGKAFFQNFTSVQQARTVVVHNNFIVGGNKKRQRFQKLGLWNVDVDGSMTTTTDPTTTTQEVSRLRRSRT